MTDAQVEHFLDAFDQADADNSGECDGEEFKKLFQQVMGKVDPRAAEIYRRGIDLDGNGKVSRDEFKAFVVAALTKDQDYTLKLVFRAFDKDRSRTLDASEIKEIGRYVGRNLSDEEVSRALQERTGDPNGQLNFAQVVKLLLNKDIADDTDPYEGKNPPPGPEDDLPESPEAPAEDAPKSESPAGQAGAAATPSGSGGQAAAQDANAGKSSCCLLL
jgi:Ca2+-binding EF-hand superfamily protein